MFISLIQSNLMSVRLSLKILVTTKPTGFYSSGNIPTGHVVVLGYFLKGWDTHTPPPQKTTFFFILGS